MFPSEKEIDTRLSVLRRQRDGIEREIADLLRFLELGRRLSEPTLTGQDGLGQFGPISGSQGLPTEAGGSPEGSLPRSGAVFSEDMLEDALENAPTADHDRRWPDRRVARAGSGAPLPTSARAMPQGRSPAVPAVAFEDDPVAARRYGRAILDAALDGLRAAARPLHAGEILACVAARGFTVPGHDPVAALNTRLWKRSGSGGPLRRLGDAVYALAEPPPA